MRSICVRLACLLALVSVVRAQPQRQAEEATSTVSGHVFCADTNAPARIASVILEPAGVVESLKPGEERHVSFRGDMVETLLDGSFVMHRVPPGSYYVVATASGYLSPLAEATFPGAGVASDPSRPKKAIAAPRITVQSGLPVNVNVTLERGASVSGTVLYDDGSPASGLYVTLLVHWKDKWLPPPSGPFDRAITGINTDDQGNYRIAGLPAREYLVQVELQRSRSSFRMDERGGTGMSMSYLDSLIFYSGGKARQSEGAPFSLSSGEDRHGEDIQIPVSKLHIVRGSLTASRDGHVLNGGHVWLQYADDKTNLSGTDISRDDENFTFAYVPEGDYIIHVDSAQDIEYIDTPAAPDAVPAVNTETRVVGRYGTADQLIHVTSDTTGIVVAVPDVQERPTAKP